MRLQYEITYLNCQSCTAKIHCEQCGRELQERLLGRCSLDAVSIDIPNRRMSVSASTLDEDDLLDLLEEMGVFAD